MVVVESAWRRTCLGDGEMGLCVSYGITGLTEHDEQSSPSSLQSSVYCIIKDEARNRMAVIKQELDIRDPFSPL